MENESFVRIQANMMLLWLMKNRGYRLYEKNPGFFQVHDVQYLCCLDV